MKKMFFLAATAALALSSCSSELEVADNNSSTVEDGAVVFSANTMRGTRATTYTTSDIVNEKYLATVGGFGVFAYEQGKAGFSTFSASTSYPNFMYNQQVYDKTATKSPSSDVTSLSEWVYEPVKYYSNNEGAKHTFFAYAPYLNNEHLSPVFGLGKAPAIRYSALQDVDLLWAAPTMDKEKAAVNEKITFNFKHALAKVKFEVAPFIDEVHGSHNSWSNKLTKGTIVTVKSIRFVGSVPSQALLDLETGKWTIENAVEGEYLINVNDVKWGEAANDVTISAYDQTIPAIKVIPAEAVKIEIVYDVETTDAATTSGANNHKEINVVVSKESFKLESGKSYNFKLDLGLTGVKFDADVTDWTSVDAQYVDLPNNHKFNTVSFVNVASSPVYMTNFEIKNSDAARTAETDTFFYIDGVLYYTAATTSPFAVAPDGVYINSTVGVYVVENGICSHYDAYMYDSKYYNGNGVEIVPAAKLISITPNSVGKVQKTDGEWIEPQDTKYYTVGSFLYQWKNS